MGVDLTWKDANGRDLDSVGDSEFHFANIVERVRQDRATRFRMTKTIDPYGITRFAPPQVTTLLCELEALRDQLSDPAVTITLGHFLSVLAPRRGQPVRGSSSSATDNAVRPWTVRKLQLRASNGRIVNVVVSIQINIPFVKRGKRTEEEEKRCDRCKKAFSQESVGRPLPASLVWWSAFFGINPGREAVKLYCESCAAWLRSLLVGVVIVGALFFLLALVLSLSTA